MTPFFPKMTLFCRQIRSKKSQKGVILKKCHFFYPYKPLIQKYFFNFLEIIINNGSESGILASTKQKENYIGRLWQ